jgi:hypothetical protein
MGYRSEVALCLSRENADAFHDYVINSLSDEAQAMIDSLLEYADSHYVHHDGDHLYVWSSLKTSCDDFVALENAINTLDIEKYLILFIGEDEGDIHSDGSYYDNPFGLYVSRSFSMDTSMCIASDDAKITNDCANVHEQTIAMNDHACPSCGNDKCSKAEKSCWKCGASL